MILITKPEVLLVQHSLKLVGYKCHRKGNWIRIQSYKEDINTR